jgi:hypothetical protein
MNIIHRIKNILWNKIIDTRYGWHDYVMNDLDDIDIDQLMTDRVESYNEDRCEAHG